MVPVALEVLISTSPVIPSSSTSSSLATYLMLLILSLLSNQSRPYVDYERERVLLWVLKNPVKDQQAFTSATAVLSSETLTLFQHMFAYLEVMNSKFGHRRPSHPKSLQIKL